MATSIDSPALSGSLLTSSDVEELTKMSIAEERPAYLSALLFHEAFESFSARSPMRKCLYYEGQWLTYGEVASRCSRAASHLAELGVGPGVVVGLMLERSFELVISILAVLQAGGCYLPCDPSYPDDRLLVYLEDGAAKVLLVKYENMERAQAMVGSDTTVVDVDTFDGGVYGYSAPALMRRIDPEDPAYCIFTSGSTGRPKGVLVPHRGLRDHAWGSAEYYDMRPGDVSLLTITINFDPHLMQIAMPLVVGGKLVLAKPGGHTDAEYIKELIQLTDVTHFVNTPSLALMHFEGDDARDCTSLRAVMFGGESMPREVINLFAEKMPSCRLFNVYGPTEASITATELYCPPTLGVITIGRPVYNMHAYVVDSALRPVPVGVPGELLLSGPRLALGYVGRPDLTVDKFIPNPCKELVAGKMHKSLAPFYEMAYRSGDLVRWRSDGTIEFLGRIDRQVKITGVRIELGEVEAAMEGVEGISQAVATAMADPSGTKRLVGYVTPATITPSAVISHCRSLLVPAMVPTAVVSLESFPLLPNGKVDVRALPAPEWSTPGGLAALAEEDDGPLDEHATSVVNIIEDILGLDASARVPMKADLFDLGASSIQVAAIAGRIRKNLDVNLDMRDVYKTPLVEFLCKTVREQKEETGGKNVARSSPGSKQRLLANPLMPQWLAPIIMEGSIRTASNIAQLISILCVVACILGSAAPGLYLVGSTASTKGLLPAFFMAPLAYIIWMISLLLVTVCAKWILIRRYQPGIYMVWGLYFMRWWIVHRLARSCEMVLNYVTGTPLLTWYLKAMGASVGASVSLKSACISDFDLISIGKGTVIEEDALITAHTIERGYLILAPVSIGNGCLVGMLSVIMPDSSLDNDVVLAPMSMVPLGAALPPLSTWEGSPVQLRKSPMAGLKGTSARVEGTGKLVSWKSNISRDDTSIGKPLSPYTIGAIQTLGPLVALILTWLALLPMAAGIVLSWRMSPLLSAAAVAFGFVAAQVLYMFGGVGVKWAVMRRCVPGRYNTRSGFGLRFGFVQSVMTAPLARSFCVLFAESPLFPVILRALGATIDGDNCVFVRLSPLMLAGADQLHFEDSVVVGNGAAILGAAVIGETLIVSPTTIQSKSYVADGAVVMPGCRLRMGALVGVKSIIEVFSTLEEGSVWSGSPALCLDPGLDAPTAIERKMQSTRWQQYQKQLSSHPNTKVLTSRGLVPVHSARATEGMSNLQPVEEEEEGQSSLALPARFTAKLNKTLNRTLSRSWPNSPTTPARQLTHTNTLLKNAATSFSQASMIVEQIQVVKGVDEGYDWLGLMVPCLIVPLWMLAALYFPVNMLHSTFKNGDAVYRLVPKAGIVFGIVSAALLYAFKFLTGRVKPASYSIHGRVEMLRSTVLAALYNVAGVVFMDALLGTRWAGYYLSALGAQVGQDVYLETIPIVETDLLTLGDRVTVGRGAQILGYLVENGCMDLLEVQIAADVTLGAQACIMPGGRLEARSAVGPLSVAMKGEIVAEGEYAEGAPLAHVGPWFNPKAPKPRLTVAHEKMIEDMRTDAQLPADIKPPGREGPPEVVLLTGATGFVGGFILRELLRPQRGVKKVYCLVRASSPEDGAERIRRQLLHHELYTIVQWEKEVAPRLVALPGDLGAPSLGLSASKFEELADEVDVIINNGALVNVTKGYESMRESNVGSLKELLRLCTGGSVRTPLHQISTVGTLPRGTGRVIKEDYFSKDPPPFGSGYDQSKWVAENLIKEARESGLPVALHRLGRIGGDSSSGGANESDYCMLIIKGCLQLRCFPKDYNFDLNIVPGDMAAKIIVDRALDPKGVGRNYHVTNPEPPPFQAAIRALRRMGYKFEEIPYAAWRERLLNCATESNALRPLEMSFGPVLPPKQLTTLSIDCTNAGIRGNTITAEQLQRQFEWCLKVKFFPKPITS